MTKWTHRWVIASIAVGAVALTTPVSAAPPQLTVQQEEQAHPGLVAAIREAEDALAKLRAAGDDFGGRRAKAIGDLKTAIHSMRSALFYRLHLDDAAIDAVNL
jgi:hypothetical protein